MAATQATVDIAAPETTAAIIDIAAPDTAAAIAPLLDSLKSVFAQLNKGVQTPAIPFTNISKLGSEPVNLWKSIIEQACNVKFEFRVSLDTNAITLHPLPPHMSSHSATLPKPNTPDNAVSGSDEGGTPASEDTTTSASGAKQTGSKGRAKKKAPRPKNAFIIYRKEWHPIIVAQCPDLHNNDISVLIGRQWKNEPREVQEKYRAMAAEEKRQHLIDNPGYQYQPRKPSEKKKRMTKNKLAKLQAQDAGAAQDPMQQANGLLVAAAADNKATITSFTAPYRQGFPTITEDHNLNGFFANAEHEDFLFNQLNAWNTDHQGSPQASAVIGLTHVDGQVPGRDVQSYPVPVNYGVNQVYPPLASAPAPSTATPSNVGAARNAEVDRQQNIFDDSLISDLFDIDAFDVEFN